MTRHAPTLFVGLGGSGIQVLRWVKTRILDGRKPESLEEEPVAFLGIDFDPRSNPTIEGVAGLGEMEFRYLNPAGIAASVNNIDRERNAVTSAGPPQEVEDSRWEFPEIRDWYPDPDQQRIRYAQTEATGAAQWRPLGRIGFFLYDRQIHEALSVALTELDRKRARSTSPGEHPTVILVSSVSGGTGSSMLFDVAVAIRKIRRGISVRAYLLLPEIFDHIDFKDRIYPNAYATLWEVANLKNQHVIFHARYPRLPEVTPADSPPPFQRVYLLGPWFGDRRPFLEPGDVYPHFGDLLRLSITKEIRSAALTAEANASADGGAPLTSPASRDMFCTVSATGLRLLTYTELADLTMRRFLAELDPESDRDLIGQMLPLPIPWPVTQLADEVNKLVSGNDPQFDVSEDSLLDFVDDYFNKEWAYRETWKHEDFTRIVRNVRRMIGSDTSVDPKVPPDLVKPLIARVRAHMNERIYGEELGPFRRSPRALERFLEQLRKKLTEDFPTRDPDLPAIENLEGFERWLDGGTRWGTLPQLLARQHLERLRDQVVDWIKKQANDRELRSAWKRHALLSGAVGAIDDILKRERERWKALEDVVRHASDELADTGTERDPRYEHLMLDGRLSSMASVIRHELNRLTAESRRSFVDQLLLEFNTFYEQFATEATRGPKSVSRWIEQTRRLFERTFGSIDKRDDPDARGTQYKLVSPESLFSDDQVKLALLRCATALFQAGRVQARATVRLARLLLPSGFRHRHSYHEKLRGWARAMLGATSSSLQEEGSDETRLVIVLEDLFHPAEDIHGIYDYYTQYAAQPEPKLFHIHRDWPDSFAPLITRAGNRGRVKCGNPGCEADIKILDRTSLFCPNCSGPIRNRCGNGGCLADDLGTRWNLRQIIDSKTCPSCKRFLRTYWWQCDDHGDIPMDKQACPECVRENRDPESISRRPDVEQRYTCPVCAARKVVRPFSVSGDVARFLRDGVNGHDQVRAERELTRVLNRDGRCPDCGTQLAPFCAEPDPHSPDRPHFLYRHRANGHTDRFRCYLHIDTVYDTCGNCDFPIEQSEQRCRRCGTSLARCRFCTPAMHRKVSARALATGRCPNCGLNSRPWHRQPGQLFAGADDDLFCSNLFACSAGGRLDDATYPAATRRCAICSSSDLPLLQARTRRAHIEKCGYCTRLFGFGDSTGPRQPRSSRDEKHCCLCGFNFGFIDVLTKADSDSCTTQASIAAHLADCPGCASRLAGNAPSPQAEAASSRQCVHGAGVVVTSGGVDSAVLQQKLSELQAHFAACAHCAHFLGGSDRAGGAGEAAREHSEVLGFVLRGTSPRDAAAPTTAPDFARHLGSCRICALLFSLDAPAPGSPPAESPHWSVSGFGIRLANAASAPAALSLDPAALFQVFLAIGTALRCNAEDDAAYRSLFDAGIVDDDFERHLLLFLDHIERQEVQRTASPRIRTLIEMHRRQFGCQSPGPRRSSCDQ